MQPYYNIHAFLVCFMVFCLIMMGCHSPSKEIENPYIPFVYQPTTDTTILSMIALQQAGEITASDAYLSHPNPAYRFQAIQPYTGPRYPDRLDGLRQLLTDSVPEVRRSTIYALGQNANKEDLARLQRAYNPWDSLRKFDHENSLVLTAIGKCGGRLEMEQLASIQTFESSDSVLLLGQAHGLFQLLLKGIFNETAVEVMTKYYFSPQYPLELRQLAGYYLMRGRRLKLDKHEFAFGKMLRSEEHFTLRANAAAVMANSGNKNYSNHLAQQLNREKNEQVIINILRALFKMPYDKVKSEVFKEITNSNPVISQMAARFFIINGEPDDASRYWDRVKKQNLDPVTSAYFAAATAKNLPFYYAITRNAAIRSIVDKLKSYKDPYTRVQLLQVLAELPEQANQILSYYDKDEHPAVNSQVVFSIQKAAQIASKNKKYVQTVNHAARQLFNKILLDQDPGVLAAMASVVRDTASTNLFAVFKKQALLRTTLDSLSLPREIETYNEIVQLLQLYGDNSVQKVKAITFAPFDKELYQKINDNTRAIIQTTAGSIECSFYYKDSPVSSMNFIKLAESKYFDNKYFHRVVPNFVIQTGCPRGDGYGSQDYVIRSELGPLKYSQAGQIGMASAGIDTESCQWFVTHLPVFHLDGRYTLFARVTNGQDVVNKIRMGDKINSVNIQF